MITEKPDIDMCSSEEITSTLKSYPMQLIEQWSALLAKYEVPDTFPWKVCPESANYCELMRCFERILGVESLSKAWWIYGLQQTEEAWAKWWIEAGKAVYDSMYKGPGAYDWS